MKEEDKEKAEGKKIRERKRGKVQDKG